MFAEPAPAFAGGPTSDNACGPHAPSVLVIDDDAAMQHMLRGYLEPHNVRVLSALRRDDATRQLTAGKPDIIVLDLRLGSDDGLDLLRDIRARSDVPVIITTGHRRDEIDRVV